MKSLLTVLLTTLMIVTTVNAEEVCFPEEQVRKMYKDIKERDLYKEKSETLENGIKLRDLSLEYRKEQVTILRESNDNLANRLEKTTKVSTWERVIWFGAGVLATGFAIKAAKEFVK